MLSISSCKIEVFEVLEMEHLTLCVCMYVCWIWFHKDNDYNFYIIYRILRHASQEAEMAFWEHSLSSLLFFTKYRQKPDQRTVTAGQPQPWL